MASDSVKLTKRSVDALPIRRAAYFVADKELPGFAVRVLRSGSKSYLVQYRVGAQLRRKALGLHGVVTAEQARHDAKVLLGHQAEWRKDRRAGRNRADPLAVERQAAARQAETVAKLCDMYLADAEAGRLLTRRRMAKKPSTLATDRGRIERHIKPRLGRQALADVTRADVERFMHDIAEGKTAAIIKTKKRGLARVTGGKGTATRTVGLLGAIFTYAMRQGMRADNPCALVIKFAEGRRERRLSDDEYAGLGAGLRQAEAAVREAEAEGKAISRDGVRRRSATIWPPAIAAVRFIVLTGWRVGEAVGLRWSEIDLARRTAILADSKTGRSMRPLSNAACHVLKTVPRLDGDRVFPPTRGAADTVLYFKNFWLRVARLARLPAEVTPHVLRHSFASLAGDLGYSEPTIGALVGHKGHSVTSRYLHSADSVLLAAADAVANRTAHLMGDKSQKAVVVPLRPARQTRSSSGA
jgi:integrase